MKDYYQILDLSPDASEQQIKERYRQLVRIFHPDRYPKAEDKVYAERKLKEINEAYEALHRTSRRGLRLSVDTRPPNPVVSPQTIDFGPVVYGERAHARLQIDNMGGLAQSLTFHQPEGDNWLQIVKGERLDQAKPLPMVLTVEAKTNSLSVGHAYESWLDIDMNGVQKRVTLAVHVVEESPSNQRLGWMVAVAVTAILLVVLTQGKEWLGWTTAASALGSSDESVASLSVGNDRLAVAGQAMPVALLPAMDSPEPANEGALRVEAAAVVTDVERSHLSAVQVSEILSDTDPSNAAVDDNLETAFTSAAIAESATLTPSPTQTPSPAPTSTPSSLPSRTPSPTSTATPPPSFTPSTTPTWTATPRPSRTPSPTPTLTPSPLPSRTPSPTPTRTATPRPSPTSTRTPFPTLSPTPTETPSPEPSGLPVVTGDQDYGSSVVVTVPQTFRINARAETSVESASLALLPKGSIYPAIARTIDNAWTRIVLPDDRLAWVFTTSMVAEIERIETLPIVLILPDADAPEISSPGVDAANGNQGTEAADPQTSGHSFDDGDGGTTSRVHRVEPGEFLKQLAERYYGSAELWILIYEANEGIIGEDPNILSSGVSLSIPASPVE